MTMNRGALGLAAIVIGLCATAGAEPAAAPEDTPPRAMYLVRAITKGKSWHEVGVLDVKAKQQLTPVHRDLEFGMWALAVHPQTGRYALSYNGELTRFEDRTVTPTKDVVVIIMAELGKGVLSIIAGDPTCIQGPCYESVNRFSPDGARVLTDIFHKSYTMMNRYSFEAAPARGAFIDKRKVKRHAGRFTLSPDLTQLAYAEGDGVYVEAMPPATSPRAAQKQPRQSKALVTRKMLFDSPLLLTPGAVVYFRREPIEQKDGFFEAVDIKSKKVTQLYKFAGGFPFWQTGAFFSPHAGVVLVDDDGDHALHAVALAGGSDKILASDIHNILDMSADGRYLLCARAGTVQKLLLVDLKLSKLTELGDGGFPNALFEYAKFLAN